MDSRAPERRSGTAPRFAFAGDRDVAVWVLDHLISQGAMPLALLVSADDRASHAGELADRCSRLESCSILTGAAFRTTTGLETLRRLDLDLIVAVHFPYLIPPEVLRVPRIGVVNLHPAFLPFNRGWHTPSWCMLDGTPAGATLHFADEGLDTGDIVHQRRLEVSPGDTAHSLYQRLKRLELEVFREAWPALSTGCHSRTRQRGGEGTMHRRRDLMTDSLQRIDLDATVRAGDLLTRLRALTTSRLDEAAFYEADGRRYRVRLTIEDDGAARAEEQK